MFFKSTKHKTVLLSLLFLWLVSFFTCQTAYARKFEPGKFTWTSYVSDRTGNLKTEIIYRGSGSDEIRFIDVETKATVYSARFDNRDIHPLDTFSPDGKTLYLLWQKNNSYIGQTSAYIELIDIYNSRLIQRFNITYGDNWDVQFSRCCNVAYVVIYESGYGEWVISYNFLDLKDTSNIQIVSGSIRSKCAPPEAYITADAKNIRLWTCDKGDVLIYPLPSISVPVPNDPEPPMPAVTVIPEGIIDSIPIPTLFKTLSRLAKDVLSAIMQPANFPAIRYAVRVVDSNKKPILGLTAGNFQVKEDGVVQSGISVVEQNKETAVSIALCLDTSGSINDSELQQIKTAANKFIDLFGANDRGALFKFATNVSLIQGFTSDKTSLKNAVNASPPDRGVTSLNDAVYDAVTLIKPESNRKAVVVLTDGYDNDSVHTLQQVIDYSLANNVPVFTLGLGSPLNVVLLQRMAGDCKGVYFNAATPDKLEEIFNKAAEDIRSRYAITYTTSNRAKDGTTRTVETIASSGGNSASAVFQYRAPQGKKPVAQIVSVAPNPAVFGQAVTFKGIGTDDGTITEYSWRSSIDGIIGNQETFQKSTLSKGDHTIYLKVRDNDDLWSDEVSTNLTIAIKATISGKVRYKNKIFNETGIGDVNATEFKPVRYADFDIIKASDNKTVLNSGETDANGNFTCDVTIKSGEAIILRCYAKQDNSDYKIQIKDFSGNIHYADSPQNTVAQDNVTVNLDIPETK